MPLKVKHARVAIIGTFHSRGAHSFWAVALRQPLQVWNIVYSFNAAALCFALDEIQCDFKFVSFSFCLPSIDFVSFHFHFASRYWQDNRITAWKFCHLLHKLLREGHPLCCQHSMRHRAMLAELGKLWVNICEDTNYNLYLCTNSYNLKCLPARIECVNIFVFMWLGSFERWLWRVHT